MNIHTRPRMAHDIAKYTLKEDIGVKIYPNEIKYTKSSTKLIAPKIKKTSLLNKFQVEA
jgi:hypothetical protein